MEELGHVTVVRLLWIVDTNTVQSVVGGRLGVNQGGLVGVLHKQPLLC